MEYHQPNIHHPYNNLPDASSSSEKALMWSTTQYMSESGYSTMAPSISSIDAFLNNEQMDSTMSNMDSTISNATAQPVAAPAPPMPQNEWNGYNAAQAKTSAPVQQPVYQEAPAQPAQPAQESVDDNTVVNWFNCQDDVEKAMKAIPDLLKLLNDEDLVVVQQAAIFFNTMSRNDGPRSALIQTNNAVQCLVDCLNTTADLETARSLVGTLYGISSQKPLGAQAIVESKALQPLVKMLR